MREVDIALFRLALLAHHVDLVPGLELGIALVIENLGNRRHAFGLRSDIDDDVGRGELHDRSFYDVIVANRFFGLVLEVVEGGGKVVAASRGTVVAEILAIFVVILVNRSAVCRSAVFMGLSVKIVILTSVRGRGWRFRGRELCVLGSVYYGRGAGVRVM